MVGHSGGSVVHLEQEVSTPFSSYLTLPISMPKLLSQGLLSIATEPTQLGKLFHSLIHQNGHLTNMHSEI